MVHPNRTKLSGRVEVDEAYIGGAESGGSTGRGTSNKALVAVAVEQNEDGVLGRTRISLVPDASNESLQGFIKSNIETKSIIITDGWSGYASLSFEDFTHEVHVKKNAAYEDDTLPHVHMTISLLKRWLLGTHQGAVSEKHIQSYLDEYVFRFNRRKSSQRGMLFYRLLECAMLIPPTTYDELIDDIE